MNQLLSKYLLFYPVRYVRGEKVWRYIDYVRSVERLSAEEVKKRQWQCTIDALKNASQNIPYYRKLFADNKIKVFNLKHPTDLAMIPPLTKQIMTDHMPQFANPVIRCRLSKRSTSGSTGVPFVFFKDRRATAFMDAVMYNAYTWHGIEIGAPQARFWGMPIDKKGRLIALAKDVLMNRRRLSAFCLTPETYQKFYAKLIKFAPHYFYGYTSLIYEFALYLDQAGMSAEEIKIKGVIGTGEVVNQQQVEVIKKVFSAPFINEYGCTEVGVIGLSCRFGRVHLMAHNIYLEVVENGSPVVNREGDIYVTELNSTSYPFIRYRLNDRGVISTRRCECGSSLPVIDVISGRKDDYVITPSGKKVYDAIFAYILKEGVAAFAAKQVRLEKVVVMVVANAQYSKELELKYTELIKASLEPTMEVEFQVVDKLPRRASGKLNYFSSCIRPDA